MLTLNNVYVIGLRKRMPLCGGQRSYTMPTFTTESWVPWLGFAIQHTNNADETKTEIHANSLSCLHGPVRDVLFRAIRGCPHE